MSRIWAAVLLCGLAISNAEAQFWPFIQRSPEPIIGLLDLPDIVGQGCGALQKRATSRLFRAPSESSAGAGILYWQEEGNAACSLRVKQNGSETEMPSLESDYEIGALIVYERRDLWFRVAAPSGSAWLRPSDSNAFLPYPDLLQERLSYLPAGWDGILRTKPGLSAPAIQLEQAWRNELERGVNIDYLGSATIGAERWLHVQLRTESCGASIPDAVPHEGWIPAYRATGAVSAWFFSRGC